MAKLIDLTNKIINNWKVIKCGGYLGHTQIYWNCICIKCNMVKDISGHILRGNLYSRCLCETTNGILNKNFGYITVIGYSLEKKEQGKCIKVRCRCNKCKRECELDKKSIINGSCKYSNVCKCYRNETGTWKTSSGYISVYQPNHPETSKKGTVFEHRLVMEKYLGRYLNNKETVHHINSKRDDNRIENLELWVSHQPIGARAEDLVSYAKEILDKYTDYKNPTKNQKNNYWEDFVSG